MSEQQPPYDLIKAKEEDALAKAGVSRSAQLLGASTPSDVEHLRQQAEEYDQTSPLREKLEQQTETQ